MSRRRAAFLLAAALSAAPAAAFDHPAVLTPTCTHNNFRILEAVLPSILSRSLRRSRNSEGLEAAQFLDEHLGLAFRIAVDQSQTTAFPGAPLIGPHTVMSYSDADQQVEVHHALLHLDGTDEEKIIQTPALLETTARRFWPTIVHEISHARNHHGSARFVASAVGEEEYIAFYRQVFFTLEQLESEPGYMGLRGVAVCGRYEADEQIEARRLVRRAQELAAQKPITRAQRAEFERLRSRLQALSDEQTRRAKRCPAIDDPEGDLSILLSLFGRSQELFERHIDSLYEEKHSLRRDDPDLIAHANAANEKEIASITELLAGRARDPVPESSPYHDTIAAQEESLGHVLQMRLKARAFWNDPAAARQGVADYRALMAAIRAEAVRKRERYQLVLKPFLPSPPPGAAPPPEPEFKY
jgi:hypothetical protein